MVTVSSARCRRRRTPRSSRVNQATLRPCSTACWPRASRRNVLPVPEDRAGRLPQELARLRRYGLIIVDEVGYLPFEQDAANLFFQLVSSRYEHASLILTSQPAVLRLGRRVRRPSRRRRDDRPHRPPRRRPHPQRRQLQAPRTRNRQPPQHPNHHRPNGALDSQQPLTIQAPETTRIGAPPTTCSSSGDDALQHRNRT